VLAEALKDVVEWLGTSCGRTLQALFGIVLLWIGIEQVTVAGLTMMMAGLITTVAAAAPRRTVRAAAQRGAIVSASRQPGRRLVP
jgi:hypothetical protein